MNIISYPQGGGGNWLWHLLWKLENNIGLNKSAEVNFHSHQEYTKSENFIVTHYPTEEKVYVFSSRNTFDTYLNFWIKARIGDNNWFKFSEASTVDQILDLTNETLWRFGPDFYSRYIKIIDLDYSNIFLDPDRFVDQLFGLLDKIKISYIEDKHLVLDSINIYKSTCVKPADHIGNYDSIGWLGWCHALCLQNRIELPAAFKDGGTSEIKEFFKTHNSYFVDKTLPYTIIK